MKKLLVLALFSTSALASPDDYAMDAYCMQQARQKVSTYNMCLKQEKRILEKTASIMQELFNDPFYDDRTRVWALIQRPSKVIIPLVNCRSKANMDRDILAISASEYYTCVSEVQRVNHSIKVRQLAAQ